MTAHKCKPPKLKELTPCVWQCPACDLYWELKATWVVFERAPRPNKAKEK